MRSAYSVPDVRAAERALMAVVPEGELMRRAASGLAAVCARLLGRCYGARVVVLAGPGDNGGDALFAGARLAGRGARVTAVATGARLHEAGARALTRAGGLVVSVASDVDAGQAHAAGQVDAAGPIAAAGLIVDGILGIGGHGGLREPAATLAGLLARARQAGAIVVAADLPSGVDADTGVAESVAIGADVTVTFGAVKPGLLIDPGAGYAGTVELVNIGLEPHLAATRPAAVALQAADVAALLPVPGARSDKYRRGVLGVLAGSERFTGAAALSVGGAVRGGAGMVRLVTARPAADLVRQHWPEAVIMVTGGASGPGWAERTVEAAGRVQAWVAGPGMGTGEDAAALLAAVLATSLPVLVDADGLTLLAVHPELAKARPAGAVTLITPHAGELGRMRNDPATAIEAHRLAAVRRAATGLGLTVLLKGSTTVVATPDPARPVYVNPTGTPWLATAGSGDVLSGLAGALLAQGVQPPEAGAAAAYLHGLAARIAADGAPIGASDVLTALPEAIRRVHAGGTIS